MNKNCNAWRDYASEFNTNSTFSNFLLHLGLGLPGIAPASIIGPEDKLLDIGCGNGINTYLLASKTTNNVMGVDPAKSAIELAKSKYSLPNLTFHISDYFSIKSVVSDNVFSLITFFYSIDYLELNEAFFIMLNSITQIGSRCFVSKFHPFWTTLYANEVDAITNNSYFTNGRVDKVSYGSQKEHLFDRYHYSLSFLFQVFKSYGWSMIKIDEPLPDVERSAFCYTGYCGDKKLMERLKTIPMTLTMEMIRGA